MDQNQQLFWIVIVALGIIGMMAIILGRYFLKVNRDSVELKQHDKEQSKRLDAIEKKNGDEQHQIDELKRIVSKQDQTILKLENRIDTLEKVILWKEEEIKRLKSTLKE